MEFVDVITRQAHPGPSVPAYRTFEDKLEDARRYHGDEDIPWTVLVDDLAGTVHQVYGGLADPTYLIDRDGRVAYYLMWTGAPALHVAIRALVEQGGRGTVNRGIERRPHMLPAMTDGWRGLARGLPQSFTDLMRAAPGSPVLPWLGYQARPMLAPLTLRAAPLPTSVKLGFAAAGALLAVRVLRARRSRARPTRRAAELW